MLQLSSRPTGRILLLAGTVIGIALGAMAFVQEAQASRIINNGNIQMGIGDYGDLNVCCGTPSASSGTRTVGIRYMALNDDATSPGCTCEGWGMAYDGFAGCYANSNMWPPVSGLTLVSFTSTSTTAQSTVKCGDLKITHEYHPSIYNNWIYTVNVTIENTGAGTLNNVLYRRDMDWDIEPTPFSEYSTISRWPHPGVGFLSTLGLPGIPSAGSVCGYDPTGLVVPLVLAEANALSRGITPTCWGGGAVPSTGLSGCNPPPIVPPAVAAASGFWTDPAAYLIYSSDNGFASSNPATGPSSMSAVGPPTDCDFYDNGPQDHGALFDFNFLAMNAGDKIHFLTYYGAFGNETAAYQGLDDVGASLYTFGQCNKASNPACSETLGTPNTFMWAFGGLENLTVPPPPPPPPPPPKGGPTAAFSIALDGAKCGDLPTTFTDRSRKGDGNITDWMWDFGDGSTSTLQSPTHIYRYGGTYTVTLTVTDDNGLSDTKTMTVHVRGVTPCPPEKTNPEEEHAAAAPPRDGRVDELADGDLDSDGVTNVEDNCMSVTNPAQLDLDEDGIGDACDDDRDGDAVANAGDDCPDVPNAAQTDLDADGVGDACDGDTDGDGVPDLTTEGLPADNCVLVPNEDQLDGNADGLGDRCQPTNALVAPADGPARAAVPERSEAGVAGLAETPGSPAPVIGAAVAAVLLAATLVYVGMRRRA